jgi:hypothetical protein
MMCVCRYCGESKSVTLFGKDRSSKSGYTSRCKECISKTRKSRAGCPKVARYNKTHSRNRKQPYTEERKQKMKARYKDKRAEILEYNRDYRKKNPEKHREKEACRRAAKLNATSQWLSACDKAHIKRVYELAKLMEQITGEAYHVDHIIPLQGKNVCGLHVPKNLQVLKADLNLSKSNIYKE